SAMLQEALGESMDKLGLSPEQSLKILAHLLAQAWQTPSGPDLSAISSNQKAKSLYDLIDELSAKLNKTYSRRIVPQALAYAENRLRNFDATAFMYLHGDPHPANALQTPDSRTGTVSSFVFVDPDGFIGDPAYDLGVVLRDWCPQLLAASDPHGLAREYCRLLASESHIDEGIIWEWSYIERVASGLYLMSLGLEEEARPFLETAEHLT
ncbi:MAG TPA: aminoglycoside phosphotransferase family protein, partial [Candidatus Polarisedimenticolaceae bacterium]|nr:aminoglycoside phosphotransferase family protein [Candidatus Polarisedimenticolaceae bacterium]